MCAYEPVKSARFQSYGICHDAQYSDWNRFSAQCHKIVTGLYQLHSSSLIWNVVLTWTSLAKLALSDAGPLLQLDCQHFG